VFFANLGRNKRFGLTSLKCVVEAK